MGVGKGKLCDSEGCRRRCVSHYCLLQGSGRKESAETKPWIWVDWVRVPSGGDRGRRPFGRQGTRGRSIGKGCWCLMGWIAAFLSFCEVVYIVRKLQVSLNRSGAKPMAGMTRSNM